jgi:2,3-bisphosphoglycerate-dependent phosphoglycerate mutase
MKPYFWMTAALVLMLASCTNPEPDPEPMEVPVLRMTKEFIEFFDQTTLEIPPKGGEETLIFLVRHAEKQEGDDPLLTEEGEARALRLANFVGPTWPEHLFSTPFRRNRATLSPLMQGLQRAPEIYQPEELEQLARQLKSNQYRGSRVVVCGHTNTVPQLANLLTGTTNFADIPEEDYSRIYLVVLYPKGKPFTKILKF